MITLSTQKRKSLEKLWFLYGNGGGKHTHGNHKFIQCILEHGEDLREFYRRPSRVLDWKPVTKECETAVDAILAQPE